MARRTRLALIALASATTLLAGCGAATKSGSVGVGNGGGSNNSWRSPANELASAFGALGHASTLTAKLELGTTASELGPILNSLGAHLTPSETATLAGAQISIEVVAPSGKTIDSLGSDASAEAFDLTVGSNGTHYLSLTSVNKTLYLKLDIKDLLAAVGQSQAYTKLQRQIATLPSFVQALFNDRWISLPSATVKAVEKSLARLGFPNLTNSPGAGEEQKLLTGLKTAFNKDIKVTRVSTGTTDHLVLSANTRTLLPSLLHTVYSVIPGEADAPGEGPPRSFPSEAVTLDAFVTGGALSELSLNLGQFDKGKALDLPLDLLFARSGPTISAPSGAVPVNAAALTQLFDELAFGGSGSSSALTSA
jgi:hypothetical protein